MKPQIRRSMAVAGLLTVALAGCSVMGLGGNRMSFFITSANPGNSGDLGGLAGADAYCEKLAGSVGADGKNWRAYLSTQATDGVPAVNARDRIGNGPWINAKGVVVAYNVAELHSDANNITQQTGLTETGAMVPARPGPVNQHDIMTGSKPDGTALPPGKDATCSNWTSSDAGGAMVGHVNRTGTNPDPVANVSWNSSHVSPGCSMPALEKVGGAGMFYCFASK